MMLKIVIPERLRENSQKLKEICSKQRKVTLEEARLQCLRVASQGKTDYSRRSMRSGFGLKAAQ
jgi:hypothetical protein